MPIKNRFFKQIEREWENLINNGYNPNKIIMPQLIYDSIIKEIYPPGAKPPKIFGMDIEIINDIDGCTPQITFLITKKGYFILSTEMIK